MKPLSGRQFVEIENLMDDLHDELARNAQGDDGQDIRNTRERYRKKLDRMLQKWNARKPTVSWKGGRK